MKVKHVFVKRKNPAEIFLVIEDVLSKKLDTQIFIDNKIYSELRKNGSNYHVFSHNYIKGRHYRNDYNNCGGEEWLALSEGSSSNLVVARGSFISNCKDYMQLVEFHSSKVKDYMHYLVGFKQLLFIQFESKK